MLLPLKTATWSLFRNKDEKKELFFQCRPVPNIQTANIHIEDIPQ